MKFCTACKTDKPLSAFNKHAARPDGLQVECRQCRKEWMLRRKSDDPARYQLNSYRAGAKKRGFNFELELRHFEVLQHAHCEYCLGTDELGFDRVDPTQGYTEGNVTPCCKYCNRMKSDLSQEQFQQQIQRIHAVQTLPF